MCNADDVNDDATFKHSIDYKPTQLIYLAIPLS